MSRFIPFFCALVLSLSCAVNDGLESSGREGCGPDGYDAAGYGEGGTTLTPGHDGGDGGSVPFDTGSGPVPESIHGVISLVHATGVLDDDTAASLGRVEARVEGNEVPVARVRWFVDAPSGAEGDGDGEGSVFSPSWPGGTGIHALEVVVDYEDGYQDRRRHIVAHTLGEAFAPPPRMPDGPWRAPAGDDPEVTNSARFVSTLAGHGPLSSSPESYTYPVYILDPSPAGRTIRDVTLHYTGFYRNYVPGPERAGEGAGPGGYSSPLTRRVDFDGIGGPPAEDEGQVIFWDQTNQEYWAFWRYQRGSGSGHATFQNGYHYGTGPGFDGSVDSRSGRGAGTSKLVGLVMRDEVDFGVVAHALDLAMPSPASEFVAPAMKSDGSGSVAGGDPPEGARFVLDPSLDVTQMPGLSREGRMVARALQVYGMFVVDGGGRNKIFVEASQTARWGQAGAGGVISTIDSNTVAPIPIERMRRVN